VIAGKVKIFTFMIMCLLISTACSSKISDTSVIGKIDYEIIKINSEEFKKLNKGNFKKWYEDNYKTGGMYVLAKDGVRYILVGAGERKTAGYKMSDLVIVGNENEIEVSVKLYGPGKNEVTAQAVTYPHILVSIKDDGRDLKFAGIDIVTKSKSLDMKHDSGSFDGITKDGLIKIKISGKPDELDSKAFRLYNGVKNSIETLGIKKGDQVLFIYYVDGDGNSVITEIRKL
jgi:hypothetical protein